MWTDGTGVGNETHATTWIAVQVDDDVEDADQMFEMFASTVLHRHVTIVIAPMMCFTRFARAVRFCQFFLETCLCLIRSLKMQENFVRSDVFGVGKETHATFMIGQSDNDVEDAERWIETFVTADTSSW